MYSPYISLIKELFVNAKIIIDRFHIVGLFSRSFNQIRVDTMKTFSTYSLDYKKLKKYWKLFLKPYRLLSSTVLSKKIHLPGRYISQLDDVNESISDDKVLEDSYSCYQIIRKDIEIEILSLLKSIWFILGIGLVLRCRYLLILALNILIILRIHLILSTLMLLLSV